MTAEAIQRDNAERAENRNAIRLLAKGVPKAANYARAVKIAAPFAAETLVAAYEARTGWRLLACVPSPVVRWLRTVGLVEAAGSKPTGVDVARGKGFHLSAFGMRVRRELIELYGAGKA